MTKLYSIGAKPYNDNVWSCNYKLSDEQVTELKDIGIGVDDPVDRLDKGFRDRVELLMKSSFWEYKMTVDKEEYDLRNEGNILFITDRSGYGFSLTEKTKDYYTNIYLSPYQSSSSYRIRAQLKEYIYRNPIQKVVLHHDFWDRPTSYAKSKVTDFGKNIIDEVPLDYPKPIVPVNVIESTGETAVSTLMAILPPSGFKIRIDLENMVETPRFWESATYKNKEMLKQWGANWDPKNKTWYFLRVPSEDIQKQIADMGIKIKVHGE